MPLARCRRVGLRESRLDRTTALASLRHMIFERFPAGPERQEWLAWLEEIANAEERLAALDLKCSDGIS